MDCPIRKTGLAAALWFTLALGTTAATSPQSDPDSATLYRTTVGPLIRKRCAPCHNARDKSGGLNLATPAGATVSGVHGPSWIAGDPSKSLLFQRIASRQMPPNMPLSAAEVDVIRRWIQSGAVWSLPPTPVSAQPANRAGNDWWSIRTGPVPAIPRVTQTGWVRTPIDSFILANLEKHGLRPAPPADRTTLIRRMFYDMLGIQPSPAERDAFLNDHSANAYERLVDRVLADPRYGERWGRHWLDVARFSESQGFERDNIRDRAWPYRDYVINALNADKPYDQFVKEQISGDVMPGATAETIAATGFLVAGPFDEAGYTSASAILRAQIREEELEDLIGTVGQTFLALTVNCARCHDHKFDPIRQRDYYQLKAVFEGVHGGDRSIPFSPEVTSRSAERSKIRARAAELSESIRLIEAGANTKSDLWSFPDLPLPLARWRFTRGATDDIGGLKGALRGGARVENGCLILDGKNSFLESEPLKHNLTERTLEAWVRLPNLDSRGGAVISIQTPDGATFDGLVFGERQPRKWTAGSSQFERTKDLDAPKEGGPLGARIHIAVTFDPENRIALYRNGTIYGAPYIPDGPNGSIRTFKRGDARILIGLRHSGTANGFLEGEILEARVYDRALTPKQIEISYRSGPTEGTREPIAARTPGTDPRLPALITERDRLDAELSLPPPISTIYAARPSEPAATYLLLRGDVQAHGDLMCAAGIASLGSSDFGLASDAKEGERRKRFGEWIVRPASRVAARVLVNRVWHYHFGRGIVGTPNDFGYNGDKPTHPELLEWLASKFMQSDEEKRQSKVGAGHSEIGNLQAAPSHPLTPSPAHPLTPSHTGHAASSQGMNWRLKPLHRMILLSSTYMQSATQNGAAMRVDSEDRWLWRFEPRRLEGEAVRDAMLVASGRINWKRGGPGFRPFVETVNNSHFYAVFDKDGADYNRRTIYRTNVNSAKSPLLDSLDCPDPSTKTPRRGITTTPLQALELMNNQFVLESARFFGHRVQIEAGIDPSRQAALAYQLALARRPTVAELERASSLVKVAGIESLCWALYNSSEFLLLR